jgi:CBS-domain-containing membrane protein
MTINDVMAHSVVTCPIGDTMENAARLMWEFDCGMIPIVQDDGRLAGVVTDRDICMAAYTQGRPLRTIPIASGMAHRPIAAHADDAIEDAENLFRDNQIRRLPVLDADGRPVGVLSLSDIVRAAAQSPRAGLDRVLVETLAAVSEPRPHITAPAPLVAITPSRPA